MSGFDDGARHQKEKDAATIAKLEARITKLREALINIAEDTSLNTDFFLQHTAQEALKQDWLERARKAVGGE